MNMAQDPYKYFRVEAREILEELGRGELEIEKGQPNPDVAPRLIAPLLAALVDVPQNRRAL